MKIITAVSCVDDLVKAVNLVLALDGQPPVRVPVGDAGLPHLVEEWVVRLDPMARKQLETAVKNYEEKIKG
jgi:hypothetical protein